MTPRSNPPGHINRETLSRELIDDRQALQAATIGAGVEHEVVRPHVIDRRRWQRPRTTGGHPPTRPFLRHLEALRPPQAVHPVGAQHVALALEEDPDRAVAVPWVLRGQG